MRSDSHFSHPFFGDFRQLDSESYREVLRFVEENHDLIAELDPANYFQFQYAYVGALYESGRYIEVVELCQELLELSILHNFTQIDGEDVYRTLLYRKASAHLYRMEFDDCIRISNQLLGLYPTDEAAGLLYERAMYQMPKTWLRRARASSVVLFLLAVILIAIELLVARPFYPEYQNLLMHARNACFAMGWVVLVGSDVYHRIAAWRKVAQCKRDIAGREF